MADIEELKQLRSSGKRKVTTLINKLKKSLQYGDPNFQTLYASLEAEYDNLVDIDLQVAEIEEEDNTYLAVTTTNYEEVLRLYFASIKEDEKIKKAKKLNCLAESIEVTVANTESVIESSRVILSNEFEKLTSKDYVQFQ